MGILLLLAGCADWPETTGASATGPWPALVPLSSLDLTPAPAEPPLAAQSLQGSAAALGGRAARLRGLTGVTSRGASLSARASILRGPAATEAERAAMRQKLAGLG